MKLVDKVKELSKPDLCPHCVMDQRDADGHPLVVCRWTALDFRVSRIQGLIETFEPCTLEDFAVCPFNKEEGNVCHS